MKKKNPAEHKTAVQIGPVRIGISTNHPAHIPDFSQKIEVKSLLTDFHRIQIIPYSEDLDGYIQIRESEEAPRILRRENRIECQGPFLSLTERAADDRYSFWGNLGLLYRYTLHLLETRHGILNLHACALYEPDSKTLFVVAGGAGSGKTVYLLSGIARGLSLFSTETVHLQIQNGTMFWHMGSLVDNVRWGSLLHDFPRFKPDIPPPPPGEVWQEKLAIDLSEYRGNEDVLRNPKGIILFPHIEEGRQEFQLIPIRDPGKAAQLIFNNVSEKTSQPFVLYNTIAVSGFDRCDMIQKRLETIRGFVRSPHIRLVASVLADPENCWGNLLTANHSQGDSK